MTPQALTEFRARCQTAKQYGRLIANAAGYCADLEAEAGPVSLPEGAEKHSTDHLIALVDKVLRVRSGEAKAAPVAAAAPVKEAKAKKKKAKKDDESEDEAEGEAEGEADDED